MPPKPANPEAAKAAEAVIANLDTNDLLVEDTVSKAQREYLATIISAHMAPAKAKAVEAGYREGLQRAFRHCSDRDCTTSFSDHFWQNSKARAALAEGKEGEDAPH